MYDAVNFDSVILRNLCHFFYHLWHLTDFNVEANGSIFIISLRFQPKKVKADLQIVCFLALKNFHSRENW